MYKILCTKMHNLINGKFSSNTDFLLEFNVIFYTIELKFNTC